ncbi:MAG TPA: hypothetical protein VK208_22965, partial [Pyrinomonadaceae bacterium]|nr:hypothetical protein [Pyrinomonadaceae bacterium]
MASTGGDGSDIIPAGPILRSRSRQILEAAQAKFSRVATIWRDDIIALTLCVIAAWGSYDLSRRIDPVIFEIGTLNIWFDADIPRIFVDMNYRDSELYTTKRHPLTPLLEYSPVYLMRKVLAFDRVTAVHLTMALLAAVWAGMFYVVLRLIGCRRFDALLFSILALTSSAAMFWLVVPETISFGSVTILLAFGFVAFAQRRRLGAFWYVLVSAATLSVTVTNWMFGVLASAVNHPMKRTAQITTYAFVLVALLWVLQKMIFPGSVFFFGSPEAELPDMESGGVLRVLSGFFFHSIVMPAIETTHWFYNPNLAVMSVEPSFPGSTGVAGDLAAAAWLVLFGLGVWALWSMKGCGRLRVFLALGLLGQLGLHLIFGREMFFYSLHYQPLLIVIAALVMLTRTRPIALALAPIVVVFGGYNNFQQFSKATEFVRGEAGQAHLVQLAIRD